MTTDAPHNAGRHPPGGRPSATPTASNAGPQGRTLWGRCWAPTPAPTAPGTHGSRTPTARPVGGQLGEGERLTSDAPHNGGRHLPRGRPSATPTVSNASPQGRTQWGWCRVPTPALTAPRTHGSQTPTARPVGGQFGEGGRLTSDAPHNGGREPPRGRSSATPTASNAGPQGRTLWGRCWVPTPAPTAPGTHWSRTPTARPVGGQLGGGGGSDLRRPSQRWKACSPGTPFRHPHSEQCRPARAHAVGLVQGPHAPTNRTQDTRVADPNSPPSGRAVGGGGASDLRRRSQRWKAAPPGTPLRHPHSEQRRSARAHAVGPLLGPHARDDRTRDTRVADPNGPPSGRTVGGGEASDLRRPSQRWKAPSPGTPFRHPQKRATPARKGARCGAGAAGSPRPRRPHPRHTGRGPQRPAQWVSSWGRGSV